MEASWFGARPVSLQLGGDFHSRRLTIRSSQVGMVSPRRRGGRSTGDRLGLALRLLQDPGFDHLLTGDSSWRDLPAVMARIASGRTAVASTPALNDANRSPPHARSNPSAICERALLCVHRNSTRCTARPIGPRRPAEGASGARPRPA